MKLRIRTKLILGFGATLFLLIAMSVFMLYQFSKANDQLSLMVDSSLRKVELSYRVLEEVREIEILNLRRSGEAGSSAAKLLAEKNEEVERLTDQLEGLADNSGRQLLNDFRSDWNDYLQVVENRSQEEKDQAMSEIRFEAEEYLERLIAKNQEDMQQEYQASASNFGTLMTTIIVLVILSSLLALGFSYWIITSVNKRIRTIARQAERIASREHYDDQFDSTIEDELNPIVASLVNVNESFQEVTENANQIATGNYSLKTPPRSDKDNLGLALKTMADSLQTATVAREKHTWLTTGLNKLNDRLMGNRTVADLSEQIISFLGEYLKAPIGAIYLKDPDSDSLILKGRYGLPAGTQVKSKFLLKEGLIGQAAYEQKEILVQDVGEEGLKIISASFEVLPKNLLVLPFTFEDQTLGVLELGTTTHLSEKEREFLSSAIENISLAIHSAISREQVEELLKETQQQSEELQTQQEELKQMNEELEEQTQNLRQQQEELQMTNEELEEQTQALEAKNKEIETAKVEVERKTEQLEITSRYKSEFLANMSHELRTPLNSLLILSRDLSENKKKNLDEDQVESAEIIYKSGNDLLQLINEVLDLSRVEAGKMSLNVERVKLSDILDQLFKLFKYQAHQKGLELRTRIGDSVPEYITTDVQRLSQVLKNLLSNALKFTEKGHISLEVESGKQSGVQFVVSDTGIGIKKDKQNTIFEAFQQAEGGTSRRYGGTGLGLAISREISTLLGGAISVESEPGKGATFKVEIPEKISGQTLEPRPSPRMIKEEPTNFSNKFLNQPAIEDDRETIQEDDKVVLLVEDDLQFAKILKKQANKKKFKVLAAATGEDGLLLAERYQPDALILDIDLPGMNGHQVLSELKANPKLRHIPVHMISVDERTLDPIRQGAVEYLMKPVDKGVLDRAFSRIEDFVNRKMKNLLIVEDDANSRVAIKKLIGNGDVTCLEAGTGKEALETMGNKTVDCIVLDIGLPDMNGFDFIEEVEKMQEKVPPIIIYTGKELSKGENEVLERYADSIIIKGVKSEERLLDETALFLHRTIENLPEQKQDIIKNLYDKETVLAGKRILVVDDDMRNVFALSKVLKEKGMEVIKADNGVTALEVLEKQPELDLVLMDIMMPEMDGYEAMKRIRAQGRFKDLPVIALTAKAMRDDKQKCLDAGASDYIPKPLDVPRLLSLMQVWLS